MGWRADFFILGGVGLLLALFASFILCDAPSSESSRELPPDWRGVGQLLRMPAYVAVILGAMLIAIGTWVFLNWLPLYFYDRFHLSLALAGLSGSSMLQLAAIIGAVVGGLSLRSSGRRIAAAQNSPALHRLLLRCSLPVSVLVEDAAGRNQHLDLPLFAHSSNWIGGRVPNHLRVSRSTATFYCPRHSQYDELYRRGD